MKNASPDQTCTTPPCGAAADQVASEAPAPGRTWLTALRAGLTELEPVIAEIVPVILGFPAS
ncbi:MAG TPA: hypothetical protein VGS06_02180 [Streptosporangiaceae bacterium]|nr:hypothetical protein [Streptosporangiaceae bacterium]